MSASRTTISSFSSVSRASIGLRCAIKFSRRCRSVTTANRNSVNFSAHFSSSSAAFSRSALMVDCRPCSAPNSSRPASNSVSIAIIFVSALSSCCASADRSEMKLSIFCAASWSSRSSSALLFLAAERARSAACCLVRASSRSRAVFSDFVFASSRFWRSPSRCAFKTDNSAVRMEMRDLRSSNDSFCALPRPPKTIPSAEMNSPASVAAARPGEVFLKRSA